jgi:ATP-dependent RNA helicase SUPV3L1/SUV3
VPTTASNKTHDIAHWDAITGGAFSAATSGERSQRVKDWLASDPAQDAVTEVYRELNTRDKGAAKLLRERLDDAKRAKAQEAIAADWQAKARALLDLSKLNIADALAWQRDAAKAGAPLSREPLAGIKLQLAERVRVIEDLQHQAQVQREAAVLLAQRIEVMSTKPWQDAQAVHSALATDVGQWQAQAEQLVAHAGWASVDMKFAPVLDTAKTQLLVVWEAFDAVLAQTLLAAQDLQAPLPPVAVWADSLRAERQQAQAAAKPAKPVADPAQREAGQTKVREVLTQLEAEVGQGHGKASAGAANALRQALKEFGRLIDAKLEAQAQAALAAAGELEGWQRWRADQLREELVIKAEGLIKRPEGQSLGGRKMQEALRAMREQWKQTDQGGVPNHGLWKRFDEACNAAHKVVETWLEKLKADALEHRLQRLALIDEVKGWAEANRTALDDDWKGFSRILHQFGDRWRNAGHLGEKAFAELQPLWKEAISHAAEPLETLQAQSVQLRQAMIEEAKVLGAAAALRIDAVKSLQQRWQAQAHAVPLDRRLEQKLWDAFRKPIDDAFQRKTAERESAEAALGQRDRAVLDASKALQAANAGGDANLIRKAMAALEAALQGQAQAQAEVSAAGAQEAQAQTAKQAADSLSPVVPAEQAASDTADAGADVLAPDALAATPASHATDSTEAAVTATQSPFQDLPADAVPVALSAPVRVAAKPVVAMRGDDRPGMQRESKAAPLRPGKWGDRKDGASAGKGPGGRDAARPGRDSRFGDNPRRDAVSRGDSFSAHLDARAAQPRLGDAAFRAQREAMESAQMALKKLAAQAHGEALTQLLGAWERRDAQAMPTLQEIGPRVQAAGRNAWAAALAQGASEDAGQQALLRLEMAAEVPTPAEHMDARRSMQLQLLTRRNDPSPQQTWAQDVAGVLATPYAPDRARRLQNTLKALLKR